MIWTSENKEHLEYSLCKANKVYFIGNLSPKLNQKESTRMLLKTTFTLPNNTPEYVKV